MGVVFNYKEPGFLGVEPGNDRLCRPDLSDLNLFISVQTHGGDDNMAMTDVDIAEPRLTEVTLAQWAFSSVEIKESALTMIAIAEPRLTGIILIY